MKIHFFLATNKLHRTYHTVRIVRTERYKTIITMKISNAIRVRVTIIAIALMISTASASSNNSSNSSSSSNNNSDTFHKASLAAQCEAICPLISPSGGGDCSNENEKRRRRRKRSLQLPNATFLTIQSRLVVPQPPVGVYLVWAILSIWLLTCIAASKSNDNDCDGNHEVHFRRAHSRRRRFVAPGARWDLLFGGEVLYEDLQFRFDLISRYDFDYLFGGNAALAAAIAAANAAALAEQETEAAVLATQGRRKRRRREDQQERKEEEEEDVQDNGVAIGAVFSGRSLHNVVTRSLADDQVDILKKIESSLDQAGLNGRECVLKAVCELTETPIHDWSVFGEMLSVLFFPKSGSHSQLDEYRSAQEVGASGGDCVSAYPNCPVSIFNVVPDVYTEADTFNITLQDFGAGSDVLKDELKKSNIDIKIVPK